MVTLRDTEDLEKHLTKKIRDLVFDTHREIVLNTPAKTGRLRGSIVVEETEDGFIIGSNLEEAIWVELGTEPHEIKPVRKKALKFNVPEGDVFAKSVQHPGTEGSHMFLKGVSFFESNLKNITK